MKALAEYLLGQAKSQGAEEAEVYSSSGTEFTVRVFRGEIESLVSAESRGIGLRTLAQGRVGFSYTSDQDRAALDQLVQEAVRNGRFNHPDGANVLPEPESIEEVEGLQAQDLREVDPQLKIQFALDLEKRAISLDPRVKRVSDAVYSDGVGRVEIYNSKGLMAAYQRSVAYGVVDAIAEQDSEMQSGFAFTYGRSLSALDLSKTAKEAVQNAVGLLGARPVKTASVPVVLHPHAGAMLLGVLGQSFSADAVLKHRSLLAGKLEQEVASQQLNIVDDARLKDGLASRPFDGEGVPSRRTELISAGRLKAYLQNTYTAKRSGSRSTANAVRSYKGVPEVGASNLVIQPGKATREELMSRVVDGLHVSQLHGLHTVNPVSGEFSLGVTGHWIKAGELTQPVRELTIAGNMIDLLRRVVGVADDIRFLFAGGFCGSPTLLIEQLPVAGT